jgi:hypothetical protein
MKWAGEREKAARRTMGSPAAVGVSLHIDSVPFYVDRQEVEKADSLPLAAEGSRLRDAKCIKPGRLPWVATRQRISHSEQSHSGQAIPYLTIEISSAMRATELRRKKTFAATNSLCFFVAMASMSWHHRLTAHVRSLSDGPP